MDDKQYLNIKEACQVIGVCDTTLRKFIKQGRLKAMRPAWRIVIAKDDLDAFMRSSVYPPKVG